MTTALYTLLANDYLKFDNVETVTFVTEGGTSIATAKAMFEPGSAGESSEMARGLGFDPSVQNAFIVLFDATLGGNRPSPACKITFDSGEVWTLQTAKQLTARTRWRCFAIKDRS